MTAPGSYKCPECGDVEFTSRRADPEGHRIDCTIAAAERLAIWNKEGKFRCFVCSKTKTKVKDMGECVFTMEEIE